MCDFKPGDEVERYREEGPWSPGDGLPPPPLGHVGVVTLVDVAACGDWLIELDNWPVEEIFGLSASEYRKVERRTDKLNLTERLSQPSGYDEEQRNPAPKAPAKRRERA